MPPSTIRQRISRATRLLDLQVNAPVGEVQSSPALTSPGPKPVIDVRAFLVPRDLFRRENEVAALAQARLAPFDLPDADLGPGEILHDRDPAVELPQPVEYLPVLLRASRARN